MTKTLLITTLLAFLVQACGLGTEVGNGARDKDKKKKDGTQASKESDDLDTGMKDGGESEPVDNAVQPKTLLYQFDTHILLNSCASPFARSYSDAINLRATVEGGRYLLSGAYDPDARSWALKDSFNKPLASVTNDPQSDDFIVNIENPDGTTLTSDWVCGTVDEKETGTGYTYQVELSKDGMTARLSWTVDTDDAKERLASITITPNTAKSALVKFEQ